MKPKEVIKKSTRKIWQKWYIAIKIAPLLILVALLKITSHYFGFEILEINALFTSLVAGTIFLIGFLISGVLSDYEESEKLPSEIAASIKTLFDDSYTIHKSKDSATALDFIEFQKIIVDSITKWFYKNETTESILNKISDMNRFLIEFEKEGVPVPYIIKMKNEQVSLRKMLLRIDTIRDTDFVISAYAILEAMGIVIGICLLIIKMTPFDTSLFFTLVVTFLISYMFLLIKDLDDPFDYQNNGEGGSEVSLKPIHDLKIALKNSL